MQTPRTLLCLAILIFMGLFSPPVQAQVRDHRTKPATTVRDHRAPTTTVRDHRTKVPRRAATPDRFDLPDNLRPAFEQVPVWRLQLRVKTGNRENANTDSRVYAQFKNSSSSIYYLDNGGNDREKRNTNTYDILDPNIRTIQDIQLLKLYITGKDGWCIEGIELLVNGAGVPVFRKSYPNCQWIDQDSGHQPVLLISGAELRRSGTWRHLANNRAIWLPPSILRRADLEQMVESYVGHLMSSDPSLKSKGIQFGSKDGRDYVEAKKVAKNKLGFHVDLESDQIIDVPVDLTFNLTADCRDNRLKLQAQDVNAEVDIPIISTLLNVFKSGLLKMPLGDINFANTSVPICPRIGVTAAGDLSMGL